MTTLYAKQKMFQLLDSYTITDENDRDVYEISQKLSFLSKKVEVAYPNGKRAFLITSKKLAWLSTYVIAFEDGEEVVIQARWSWKKPRLTISSQRYELDIMGDWWARKYDVYNGHQHIGTVERKLFKLTDQFVLEIHDDDYQLLMVGLMIALDHIQDSAH